MGLTDQTFFISYSIKDITFAHEIEQTLKNAGCRTIRQKKDSGNTTFISTVHEALDSNARIIAVYSDDYFSSPECVEEAYAALKTDPQNKQERLLPMLVREGSPAGLLSSVPYLDLVTIFENNEMEALKEAVLACAEPGAYAEQSGSMSQLWHSAGPLMHPEIYAQPSFTGRDKELSDISSLLAERGFGAFTAADGIGKSATARQYAWNNRDAYTGIWWVKADTQDNIINSFLELGEKLQPGIMFNADREEAAHAVMQLLSETSSEAPWLLIYDNLESPALIEELAPDTNAHILITSRRRDLQGYSEQIELDIFTEEEAVRFLIKRTGDEHQADAGHLARLLGYMPLALELAAAYCKAHYGYENYLKLCRKQINSAPKFPEGYPVNVWAAFTIAMDGVMAGDVLKDIRPCPHGEKLLGPLAYFAPEDIPTDIFSEKFMAYPRRIEAMNSLQNASLVKLTQLTNYDTGLSLHTLIQDMIQDRMDANEQSETCIERATAFALNNFPGRDASSAERENWPRCMQMENHIRTVLAYAPDSGDTAQQTSLLLNLYGIYLFARGDYHSAEPVMKWTLSIDEENCGKDHPNVSSHLNNLAQLYKETDRIKEAEPLMLRALSIDEENFGPDNLLLATHSNNLGQLYLLLGQEDKAEDYIKRSIDIFEKNNPDIQPYYAGALNNLGKLYLNTGQLQEASTLLNRAQSHAEQFFTPDDPRLENIQGNLQLLKSLKTAELINEMEHKKPAQTLNSTEHLQLVNQTHNSVVSEHTIRAQQYVHEVEPPQNTSETVVAEERVEVRSQPTPEKKESKGIFSRLFRNK